jgi:hypothetical protein
MPSYVMCCVNRRFRGTLDTLVPRLLVQYSVRSPALSSPRHHSIPALTCYLLAHLYRPFLSPFLSTDFPFGLLSLPSCPCIAGCFQLVAQSAATCSRWFFARGFFYPLDGGDMFLLNVGSHKIYAAPHPRVRHSS